MGREHTADDRRQAVESLFRVRAVESPAEATGEKEVWHQASQGAELVSLVNRSGHLLRQEFTLFDDHFLWTKADGLQSGAVVQARGVKGLAKASGGYELDDGVNPQRVQRAIAALRAYKGDDKYLLHLRVILDLAAQGSAAAHGAADSGTPLEFSQVTGAMNPLPRDLLYPPEPRAAAPLWPFLVGGLAVGVVVVVAIYFSLG